MQGLRPPIFRRYPARQVTGCATFGKCLCGLAYDLSAEYVPDRIHHDPRLFVPIVTHQLREILKAQQHGNLVASCSGNEIVKPLEIYRRQLIYDNRGFEHPFLVHELDNAGVIQDHLQKYVSRNSEGLKTNTAACRRLYRCSLRGSNPGPQH